ncbi:MAG: CapA family protein [Patescibacteria group bacterium]|nr:CapA family protein [Patescibacteria group bacterium]MDE2172451.1 CapA family protein [Patescibacteria group bacterium]
MNQSSFQGGSLHRKVAAAIACFIFGFGALWATKQFLGAGLGDYSGTSAGGVSAAQVIGADTESLPPQTDSLMAPGHTWPIATPLVTTAAPATASMLESVKQSPAEPSVTVLMGGDVMLDRHVRLLGMTYGYDSLFAGISDLMKTADISVVNLEGTITSSPSRTLLADNNTTQELSFTFDPATAAVLKKSGIDLVSLANNHADNFGVQGLRETQSYLAHAGVGYFGDPWNDSGTEKIISKNGITLAFVGYHAFQGGFDRVIATVKRLSADGDFVIVMPHWGIEYAALATVDQHARARALAAAGAGAIIGSHPHVTEDHEWLPAADGSFVPVYYSLGNLLFDQYFSPSVMEGNIISLTITRNAAGKAKLSGLQVFTTSLATHFGPEIISMPTADDPPSTVIPSPSP